MASTVKGNVPPISTSQGKKRNKKKKKGGIANAPAGELAPSPAEDAAEETPSPTKGDAADSDDSEPEESKTRRVGTSTETSVDDETVAALTNGMSSADFSDTTARFDALVKDRDTLRNEVTQLRQSLEALQSKHDKDLESVREQLQDTQNEKDEAQEQYQNLLGKVNTIRSQLGERLKADAEDLAQARTRIEELEEQKSGLQEQYTAKSAEVEELTSENKAQSKELSSLRNRANLSQQNWIKERDELIEQEAYMREELENTKQAMHDWEVLAMEERTVRKDLAEKASDLEEQLASLKAAYEKADHDRTTQSNAVEGLQKALQEIQTARKTELRELVESSQAESESLKKQLQEAQAITTSATTELENTKKELERASQFEKEVKEKNLLIGKLRHEAVILNDHLTKALRFLKKGKPEDNVDRQIVTSYLIQFLALERADPKKFQILQLIAALLGWTDEQKEKAGLQRTGAPSMTGSLRLPSSPLVHRTPSSPALGSDYFPDSALSPDRKESLADLWQNFLEREASQSGTSRSGMSRTGSTSTNNEGEHALQPAHASEQQASGITKAKATKLPNVFKRVSKLFTGPHNASLEPSRVINKLTPAACFADLTLLKLPNSTRQPAQRGSRREVFNQDKSTKDNEVNMQGQPISQQDPLINRSISAAYTQTVDKSFPAMPISDQGRLNKRHSLIPLRRVHRNSHLTLNHHYINEQAARHASKRLTPKTPVEDSDSDWVTEEEKWDDSVDDPRRVAPHDNTATRQPAAFNPGHRGGVIISSILLERSFSQLTAMDTDYAPREWQPESHQRHISNATANAEFHAIVQDAHDSNDHTFNDQASEGDLPGDASPLHHGHSMLHTARHRASPSLQRQSNSSDLHTSFAGSDAFDQALQAAVPSSQTEATTSTESSISLPFIPTGSDIINATDAPAVAGAEDFTATAPLHSPPQAQPSAFSPSPPPLAETQEILQFVYELESQVDDLTIQCRYLVDTLEDARTVIAGAEAAYDAVEARVERLRGENRRL